MKAEGKTRMNTHELRHNYIKKGPSGDQDTIRVFELACGTCHPDLPAPKVR